MPAIQQVSSQQIPSTAVFNLSATQQVAAPLSIPIIAVNSSLIKPLAVSNPSVTAKARVIRQAGSTRGEKRRGVKHITPCLNDYYVRNNNSVTHRLVNICEHATIVSGYVDLECNVDYPNKNHLNQFTLNKQGDLYTVETKKSKECEQAIVTENMPTKLGDCLYGFRTLNDNEGVAEEKVINECEHAVAGYVDTHCLLDASHARFTLNSGELLALNTNYFCNRAVFEGYPPIKIDDCLQDFVTKNDNGTATHKIINICYTPESGYVRKGCVVSPSSDEWHSFVLKKDASTAFLIQDKNECESPIRAGHSPVTSYEKLHCPAQNASLADLPNLPEKIVGGKGVLAQDTRHLVSIESNNGRCSGSLIGDRFVLTAAHCFKKTRDSKQSDPLESIKVYHDPQPQMQGIQYRPRTSYKVKAGFIAPCYVNTYMDNCDLALLKLQKPAVNAKTLVLPTDQDFCEFAKEVDKVLATDTAFPDDLSGQYDKTQPVWQEGNALAQGFGQVKGANGNLVSSDRAKQGKLVAIAAGRKDGVISTLPSLQGDNICYGDSGGPLIYRAKDGRKVQVGVTCCFNDKYSEQCTGGASYTNLHNKVHRAWLEQSMAQGSRPAVVKSGDATRLRFSPDTCVEKTDVPDGFFSQLKSLSSSYYWRKTTFTNKCRNKGHPATVNIKFYSDQNNQISGSAENTIQLTPGEIKEFSTYGPALITDLAWSDLD